MYLGSINLKQYISKDHLVRDRSLRGPLYLVSWESKPLLVHLQPYCIPALMWQTIYYYKLKSDSYTIGPNSIDGWILQRLDHKVCLVEKDTTFWNGNFTTIPGHFFANYINIFHKIELQMIILMCLTYLNPFWIKSFDVKYIFGFVNQTT